MFFFYEVISGHPLRMGVVVRRTNQVIKKLKLSLLPLTSKEGQGLKMELNHQWCHLLGSKSCLVLRGNTPIQTHTSTHWDLVQGQKNSAQERHFRKEFCLE